ncbi:MAG: hypothetical protein AAF533_20825 [Acidobacteriota bacterium]
MIWMPLVLAGLLPVVLSALGAWLGPRRPWLTVLGVGLALGCGLGSAITPAWPVREVLQWLPLALVVVLVLGLIEVRELGPLALRIAITTVVSVVVTHSLLKPILSRWSDLHVIGLLLGVAAVVGHLLTWGRRSVGRDGLGTLLGLCLVGAASSGVTFLSGSARNAQLIGGWLATVGGLTLVSMAWRTVGASGGGWLGKRLGAASWLTAVAAKLGADVAARSERLRGPLVLLLPVISWLLLAGAYVPVPWPTLGCLAAGLVLAVSLPALGKGSETMSSRLGRLVLTALPLVVAVVLAWQASSAADEGGLPY